MDKYTVKGVELEYDTFDVDSIERYEREMERVGEETRLEDQNESGPQRLRRICEAIIDFFDAVVSDGTAERIFGSQVNVEVCFDAYSDFVNAVTERMVSLKTKMSGETVTQLNRAQRRSARSK